MNKTTTEIAKEILTTASPEDASQYLIYMLILFMCIFMISGLVAFYLWLRYHKVSKTETTATPHSRSTMGGVEQTMMIGQHELAIKDIRTRTLENAESVGKLSEVVSQLVQVVESQGSRMLQHDSVIQQLYSVVSKQNEIIRSFYDES